MELFADFTGHTEGWCCWGGGGLTEWKSGRIRAALRGPAQLRDARTFLIRDGVTAALFCAVSALDIQLLAASQGRASLLPLSLPLSQKNLARAHSS